MNRSNLIIAFCASMAFLVGGCSILTKLESPAAQPFDAIAIAVAVDAVVGTNPVVSAPRASAVKTIAQEVLAADTGTLVTVDALFAVAQSKVAALNLAPGDQAAAALFLAVIKGAADQYTLKATSTANAANAQAAIAFVCNAVIAEATRLGG